MPNIVCNSKGPNICHGIEKVLKADGTEVLIEEGKAVALCACGKSANAPFCDGSHKKEE
jgi:CDGSH-type Zn-finger protein